VPGDDDVAFVQALTETYPHRAGTRLRDPGHFRIAYCVEDHTIERAMDGFRRGEEWHG
jgi:aspartate aminotransferase